MKPHVVVYRQIPDDLFKQLAQTCHVTYFNGIQTETERAAFTRALADADGLLGVGVTITPALLASATKLKAISTISVGYDAYDLETLTSRNIALMNTPGVLTEATADTIFTLILCSARRIIELSEVVRNGLWKGTMGSEWYGSNVYGKTLGILGMGRIGEAVARRGHFGFGMNIIYYNRSAKPDVEQAMDACRVSADELFAQADFVCNVLPLTEETRHFYNADAFAKMKTSAFFINGGRGASVDETALYHALKNKTIAGAGLDVFEKEPISLNSPLLTVPNLTALPHAGSATHETRYAMSKMAVDNLLNALRGDLSKNCVNPQIHVQKCLD